ncbi:3'(2'),5'-bisphosphate nucleotidase CysQ [Endozoicomonas sp. Mp262]|uniref:3'(2'),5'-bisphosphate nucleotidase CysQ n=1 Tax=Endozoicomonas sp. Mp262 TaxID=2919499 RepID=UPI0021D845C1
MINEKLIAQLKEIAYQAGQAILQVYGQDDVGIQTKDDKTPVTQADLKANAVIERGLNSLEFDFPILSEESAHTPYQERKNWQHYWLVDPLDGTKEFINRNGQFTVNIALMDRHYPVFGIVHTPVTQVSYWGGASCGAYRQRGDEAAEQISTRSLAATGDIIALGSRSYGNSQSDQFIEKLKQRYPSIQFERVGSSLKGCRIAEGNADIYPRLGPTSEWDTAAVQAVVEGAGGLMLNPDGERFKYNFKESLKNSHFMILGDKAVEWQQFWNKAHLS